jgi:hypothetical protein
MSLSDQRACNLIAEGWRHHLNEVAPLLFR